MRASRFKKWCLQYIDDPFKLYKLENVFYTGFIKKLRKELLELQFNHNVSDMFSVHQTCELYGLEGTVNNVNLITFLQFLNKFREFLMQLFSIPLKEQISVSGSMFTKGDYLLCHDDKLDDRAIAFILYLNEDWKNEWGGSLDLFNRDDNDQPSNVAYSIFPECNRLLFFRVGDHTYHQVSEILSDVSRLTINGWFHTSEVCLHPEPSLLEQPISFSALVPLSKELSLSSIMDEVGGDLLRLRTKIIKSKFLSKHFYDAIKMELSSGDVTWRKVGPANERKYYYAEDVTNLRMTKMLNDIFASSEIIYLLTALVEMETGPKWENSDLAAVHVEFQKWTPSCYLLANSRMGKHKHRSLDVFVFFDVTEHNKIASKKQDTDDDDDDEEEDDDKEEIDIICTGNIYYVADYCTSPMRELRPKSNHLYIVQRTTNEHWFINYVSHMMFSGAYYVMYASYSRC